MFATIVSGCVHTGSRLLDQNDHVLLDLTSFPMPWSRLGEERLLRACLAAEQRHLISASTTGMSVELHAETMERKMYWKLGWV